MKIALCCPNRDSDFKGETVSTIARLIWDICALGHQPMYISSNSCFIDKARNMLWDAVKEQHCDYMMIMSNESVLDPVLKTAYTNISKLNKPVVILG